MLNNMKMVKYVNAYIICGGVMSKKKCPICVLYNMCMIP